MTRPLIGLTGRRKTGADLVDNPKTLHQLDGDWYYADYARGVLEAGGLPVHLPLDVDPTLFIGRIDGLLLSGGADIDPEHYGATAETDDFPPEPGRDAFEISLLRAAMRVQLPVLGICRGLQMINVANGGTLHQHVPGHAAFDRPPATIMHRLTIEPDSTLGSIYGADLAVNSLHHQTVARVGDGLRVTARSADDTVEGLEHQTLPIVAVQWHPEMLVTRSTDPIFGWLCEAAEQHDRVVASNV